MIVEPLAEQGSTDPRLPYESPIVEIAPSGPQQVFADVEVRRLVRTIAAFNESAVA